MKPIKSAALFVSYHMLLKEIKRTATTAWCPVSYQHQNHICPLIATGSVAGAFDASFSSSTELELFALNLDDPSSTEGIIKLGAAPATSRYSIQLKS